MDAFEVVLQFQAKIQELIFKNINCTGCKGAKKIARCGCLLVITELFNIASLILMQRNLLLRNG